MAAAYTTLRLECGQLDPQALTYGRADLLKVFREQPNSQQDQAVEIARQVPLPWEVSDLK